MNRVCCIAILQLTIHDAAIAGSRCSNKYQRVLVALMRIVGCLIVLIFMLCGSTSAQTTQESSLLTAHQAIEQSQSEFTIDNVSDGLGKLATKANVEGLDAVAAVKRVCKGLPVKVQGNHIYVQAKRQTERKIILKGDVLSIKVVNYFFKRNICF